MPAEQDHVDRFLEQIAPELPGLDLEVEGIVDRIGALSKRFRREMDDTLSGFGLNYGEWGVLGALRRAGPRSPGQLSKYSDLSSGAMTSRLDGMEEAGLIRRKRDTDDRRGVQVELTKKGHRVYEKAVEAQAAKEQLVASALNAAEKRKLNSLLRTLLIEFERQERED